MQIVAAQQNTRKTSEYKGKNVVKAFNRQETLSSHAHVEQFPTSILLLSSFRKKHASRGSIN